MPYRRETCSSLDELGRPGTAAIPVVLATVVSLAMYRAIQAVRFAEISGFEFVWKALALTLCGVATTVTAGLSGKRWAPSMMTLLDRPARPIASLLDRLGRSLFRPVYESDGTSGEIAQNQAEDSDAQHRLER